MDFQTSIECQHMTKLKKHISIEIRICLTVIIVKNLYNAYLPVLP